MKLSPRKLETLPEVRDEISAVYFLAKEGVLLLPHARELSGILTKLAGVIKDHKEMDVEEQLNELRAAIAEMKQTNQTEGAN